MITQLALMLGRPSTDAVFPKEFFWISLTQAKTNMLLERHILLTVFFTTLESRLD